MTIVVQDGYTKAQRYPKEHWPDADKIPIDYMFSSCAAGIIGSYCYANTRAVIQSVANARKLAERLKEERPGTEGNPFSMRRTFLIFADEYFGDKHSRGGTGLAKAIEENKLGSVVTLGPAQNIQYTADHKCQIWLWQPDYPAIDKLVGEWGAKKEKELF